MKALLLLLLILVWSNVFALNAKVSRQDWKLATQQMIEKQSISAPELGDADQMLATQATSNTVTTTVTSFLAQPDVCRNLEILPGGTTADVPAGDITVTGTNFFGETITETFTLTANQATADVGVKAFCSVTSIVFPVQDGAGATYDFGTGEKLGLKRCMENAGHYLHGTHNDAFEATRATVVADVDEIEKNTVQLNTALDGSDVELFFMQNWRCLP